MLDFMRYMLPTISPFAGPGQSFYVVDSDFQTIWGQTDGTGLPDFYSTMAPGRVFRTGDYRDDDDAIQAAIDAAIGGRGDTVWITPGDYRVVDSIAVNKRGIRILGQPVQNPSRALVTLDGDTTAGLTDEIFNITAADVEIGFLRIIPDSGFIAFDFSAAANRLYCHHLFFDMETPAISAQTRGLVAIGAAANCLFEKIWWKSDGAQGSGLVTAGLLDSVIRKCYFFCRQSVNTTGIWASPWDVGAAVNGVIGEDLHFITSSGGVMTRPLDGANATIAGGLKLENCRFPSELGAAPIVPVGGFSASECTLVECYMAGAGAGDGGTLITVIA